MRRKRIIRRYRYFMFLNSSVRGPFYPSFQPQGWAWPRAFTDRLSADVKVVASSIVCLPEVDAGGFGPKARRLNSLVTGSQIPTPRRTASCSIEFVCALA